MVSAVTKFVDAYIAAYNAKDVDALLEFYTENATLEDPVGSPLKSGREDLRSFWENAVKFDMVLEPGNAALACGDEAAISLRVKIGTASGQRQLEIINIVAFANDGRLKSVRSFYDVSAMEEAFIAS